MIQDFNIVFPKNNDYSRVRAETASGLEDELLEIENNLLFFPITFNEEGGGKPFCQIVRENLFEFSDDGLIYYYNGSIITIKSSKILELILRVYNFDFKASEGIYCEIEGKNKVYLPDFDIIVFADDNFMDCLNNVKNYCDIGAEIDIVKSEIHKDLFILIPQK